MKKKIILTGATGFLGSHFASRIDLHKYQAHLFSRHGDSVSKISAIDLIDFLEVQKTVQDIEPDIIVHVGGLVNLARDFDVAKQCIDANITGTLNLLEAMRDHAPKLFIYVSTEEVYGDAPIPYRENISLTHPPSPYAMTKLGGEHLSWMYGQYIGFPVIILRIGTMYGPGDIEKRFIPSIITKALRHDDIPLNSGTKARDYVFVDDVVDALIACLALARPQDADVINIGGGVPYTLRSVVEKIVKLCQSTSSIRYGAFPDRVLEANRWEMDIQKAKRVLGWHPKTSLEVGLAQTIAYYKKLVG